MGEAVLRISQMHFIYVHILCFVGQYHMYRKVGKRVQRVPMYPTRVSLIINVLQLYVHLS